MPKNIAISRLRTLCPDYPTTPHIHQIQSPVGVRVLATEKLDGANAAIFLDGDQVVLRNRTHILRKGYEKDTPAKKQFVPLFSWAHANKKRLIELHKRVGFPVAVYGEWLWALHGVRYQDLPSPFVAFAVRELHARENGVVGFMDPFLAHRHLVSCGFVVPPVVNEGSWDSGWFSPRKSEWGNEPSEGVVVSWGDGRRMIGCAKWVRPDYVQNSLWNDQVITRQG
jgi:hypothetical protein